MRIDKLGDWHRTHYSVDINPELDGKEVTVLGWIQEIRDLGGIIFIILQDREGTVQITVPRKKLDEKIVAKATELKTRYSIGVRGVVQKTKLTPRGIEIIPTEIRTLSIAEQPLPIDITGKMPAQLDVRLDARPLDIASQENIAVFKIEHRVLQTMRTFLSEKGFIEVHTPRIIASATEGGTALFAVNYYEQQAYLAQSPQLYKEQLVQSLEKVFEIGPFFRAEESHTRRHLSEFISLDIEQAFATTNNVMQTLEQLVHTVCLAVKENCTKELQTLKRKIEAPELPFKRYTYEEIFNELEKSEVKIPWGVDIPTPACRVLGKLHPYFYFITDWPVEAKPFYIQPKEDNPKLSEGFDLMWRWIEIASGGARVHSKDVLIQRLTEQKLNPESFKHHLKAFDYGMPPHAGWAVGFERLIMLLTGKKNIREVVLFPRDRFRLSP